MDDLFEHTNPPHGVPRIKFDDDTLDRIRSKIREEWATSQSVAEIAAKISSELQLPISKNMISGHVHRMKLDKRPDPIQRSGPRPARKWTDKKTRKQKFNPTPKVHRPKSWFEGAKPPVEPYKAKELRKSLNPIPMEALEHRSCRWPEWGNEERPVYLYCGERNTIGFSYCPYHLSFAFSNLQPERIKDNGHASPEQAHGSNGSADSMVRQVASELPEDADTGGTLQARNGADTSPAGV